MISSFQDISKSSLLINFFFVIFMIINKIIILRKFVYKIFWQGPFTKVEAHKMKNCWEFSHLRKFLFKKVSAPKEANNC